VRGRWKEAEDVIKKSLSLAYEYVENILRDRWIEAEPFILNGKKNSLEYCLRYNVRLPEERHNRVVAEVAFEKDFTNQSLKKRYIYRIK
jgi:hypothetical protein